MDSVLAAKRCSTCREDLPHGEFDACKRSPDGLAYWCRACRARYHRRYKRRQAETSGWGRVPWEAMMWAAARKRAQASGVQFEIEVADISIPSACPILGTKLMRSAPSQRNRASLDRIDNARGYVPGNVAVISMAANAAKSNLAPDEIIRLAEYVRRAKQ